MSTLTHSRALKAAFAHTIPVLTGFLVLGMAYGVLMQSKGYGPLWSVCMSAVAFCGSMQFVAITLLTTAFDPIQAFLLSLMVNARHLFYGISMLQTYKGLGKIRGFLVYTLCDETFSIASSVQPPEGVDRGKFYGFISLLNYCYWVLGSLLGGLVGGLVTFNTKGLDFVLTALFVVLFLEQMRTKENCIFGCIGLGCTLLCAVAVRLYFPGANLVIPAMLLILAVLLLGRNKLCR